jgi:photosystem II stability/assembly factor-like uncharacterized protein
VNPGWVLVFALPFATGAQTPAPSDTSAFGALAWREIGPYRGGRSVAVAGSEARPGEYYMGTTGGGVFKTTDGGASWAPATDKYFGGTIGAIAVSESNPDIVYVGAGEPDMRGDVSYGDGMFKSTDAGKTWTSVGLANAEQIARVRIDARDPNVVYVGVQGHVWAPSAERGVYKTTDGGANWRRILFRNDSTGVSDLVVDPLDRTTIYAAFWQVGRAPWKLVSGGAGSGIFKSADAGEHWTEITRRPGLPIGVIGNVALAVSPARPGRVWALIEADSGGVFRSDDAGATWIRTNADRTLRQRAWYYTRIYADPKDSNQVYGLNVDMMRSSDGGKTFTAVKGRHDDHHDLWIAATDPRRMIEADDGGAIVSTDAGATWTQEPQPTGQFYHVATTNDFPYKVCGAQQDIGTWCGPSRAPGGVALSDWFGVGGGESGYIAARPDSTNIIFAGSYDANMTRIDIHTGALRNINPWPDIPMGHAAGDIRHRFQWTYPIALSPNDPNVLYAAAQSVFRSTDDGASWTVISPDLTRHDPRTLGPSGGPITHDQTSIEYYATIFALAESPKAKGEIWVGSDDGEIHLTRDGGTSWSVVTPKGLPEWTRISIIEPSHFDAATAYVAANHYQMDDRRPYLYKTTDYGRTWTAIVNGLPATEFTRVIREDPERRGLLYVRTERRVWVSFDDGLHWQSLSQNLPPVPVHDLAVTNGDLVAATHGRGFWILDDISPLRQWTPEVSRSAARLFTPRPAYVIRDPDEPNDRSHGRQITAANPPSGVVVYYQLAAPARLVTLDFLDARGNVIRSLASGRDSAKAGLNVSHWDLRYPAARGFEGMVLWGKMHGALAVPGTYAVRMTVDGYSETRPFEVREDPRSSATQADLVAQFDLLQRIRDTVSAANDAVRTIRHVRAAIAQRDSEVPAASRARFRAIAEPLLDSLSRIEAEIYQVRNRAAQDPLNFPIKVNDKLAALAGVVETSDTRPTAQSYAVFQELSGQLATQLDRVHAQWRDLTRINALLRSANLEAISPEPPPPPA